MIKFTGFASKELVKTKFPDEKYLIKPKAIIECYQEIPCNPCSTSCPVNAITIGDDINQIPTIDFDLCIGCGQCVYSCPGLAIMLASIKDDLAIFKIPYELYPLPQVNDVWLGVNRSGDVICDALITHILINKATDRTAVLTVSVPKKYLYDFRTVRCPNE